MLPQGRDLCTARFHAPVTLLFTFGLPQELGLAQEAKSLFGSLPGDGVHVFPVAVSATQQKPPATLFVVTVGGMYLCGMIRSWDGSSSVSRVFAHSIHYFCGETIFAMFVAPMVLCAHWLSGGSCLRNVCCPKDRGETRVGKRVEVSVRGVCPPPRLPA